MKNALFIIENFGFSGSPLTALHFVQNMPSDVRVTVLATSVLSVEDMHRMSEFQASGVSVVNLKIPHFHTRKFKLFYLYFIRKILKEINKCCKSLHPDYIYINRSKIAGPIAVFIKKHFKNCKIIFNSLGKTQLTYKIGFLTNIFQKSIKDICLMCDYYIAISEECFEQKYIIKGKKVLLGDYCDLKEKKGKKIFSKKGIIRLGQLGYFCHNKNQIHSLKILQKLLENKCDATLVLLGYPHDKKYFNKMNQLLELYHLKENVHFVPKDFDKKDFFEKIDLLLMPSYKEGFGLVIKESLSQKTPVLSSEFLPQQVEDYGTKRISLMKTQDWCDYIVKESYKKEIDTSILKEEKRLFREAISKIFI